MYGYNNIKNANPDSIVIIKNGIFYNTFYDDAKIISYIMNYKLFYYNNILCVSFPDKNLYLLLSRLRIRNVGYIVIDNKNIESYIGAPFSYNSLLNEAKIVKDKELIINKIVNKLKTLNIDEIEKIYEIIEKE